jgi:hypothetical protein
MSTLPLELRDGHVFVNIEGNRWLIDTGAPTSFGDCGRLTMEGQLFAVGTNYLALDAATLSRFVGVQCVGLLGADVLGCFDHLFDTTGGRLTVSASEVSHGGQRIQLEQFMGIPIVTAQIGSGRYRMFFDTGAQISYLQDSSLTEFSPAGTITDFYPGFGQFTTPTYDVPVSLGGVGFTLRCGTLPGLLGETLSLASTQGIISNAILRDRTVGYFPRRSTMVL